MWRRGPLQPESLSRGQQQPAATRQTSRMHLPRLPPEPSSGPVSTTSSSSLPLAIPTAGYRAAAEALRQATNIIITTHINPDGDGIGAGLALQIALTRLGKQVRFLCPSKLAPVYTFLPEFAGIRVVNDVAVAKAEPAAEVIISCDAGDIQRIGAVWNVPRTTFINLDHHVTNTNFGDLNLVDVGAESSGVAVSRLLAELGAPIDRVIAECLYTTIVFDTGRFMHSNTTAHTFRWTADLLETGIDASAINRKLTYTRTLKDLAITRLALEHLAVDSVDSRVAGIVLTAEAIAAVGEPEDWGDMVELPRSLIGNEVAYVLREKRLADGTTVIKASLRSNPPYAIGQVAQQFGGGGHAQAAGATIPGKLDDIVPQIVAGLRAALK